MRRALPSPLFRLRFLFSPTGESASWAVAESVQLSVDQALSIAEKQHEIASFLIKEGRFDRVLPEMKILDLNLQGEHEQLVAKSASFISYLWLRINRRDGTSIAG